MLRVSEGRADWFLRTIINQVRLSHSMRLMFSSSFAVSPLQTDMRWPHRAAETKLPGWKSMSCGN